MSGRTRALLPAVQRIIFIVKEFPSPQARSSVLDRERVESLEPRSPFECLSVPYVPVSVFTSELT
jgi:hypothetical protein